MATVDAAGRHVPAWRGGFGRLWTAAVVSRFGDALRTAALPLGSANARLMTGQQLAGGLPASPLVPLLLAVGAFMPFAADASTYLLAAALVASLRARPPEREPRPAGSTLRAEMGEGLRALWADRTLRAICVATLLCNIGMGAQIAMLVLHVTRWLDAGTAGYAAAMTAYSAGSFSGGFVAQRIARRTGRARALLVAGTVQTSSLLLIGTVRHLGILVAGMLLLGAMNMVWNVNQVTLMQQRSPASMVGRIASAFRTASTSGAPIGALLGGAVARVYGLNGPALLAAALFAFAAASLIPAVKPDVPVVAQQDDPTTAHVTG